MKITVTKDHWENAKEQCTLPIPDDRNWCRSCVLGQAFVDAGVADVGVGYFNVTRGSQVAKLPEAAVLVRKSFDQMMHRINFKNPVPYEEPSFPVEFEVEFKDPS